MNESFFLRDTRVVARDLLGREIVRVVDNRTIRAVIIETEVYDGYEDRASHASRGKTKRNAPMFGAPATLYVYLVYGMHWCMNFVTGSRGYPAAVLIRAVRLMPSQKIISGPGRVTKALLVTKYFNNQNLIGNTRLIVGRRLCKPKKIIAAPRIGVGYAGSWAKKPLRFFIES